MQEGIVKWFNKKKNYGFIESEGQEEVFFHGSKVIDHGFFGIKSDDRVTYKIVDTRHGRQAVEVRVVS